MKRFLILILLGILSALFVVATLPVIIVVIIIILTIAFEAYLFGDFKADSYVICEILEHHKWLSSEEIYKLAKKEFPIRLGIVRNTLDILKDKKIVTVVYESGVDKWSLITTRDEYYVG